MNLFLLSFVSSVWTKAWPILVAVVFFGFIIFIHEFGHFIFAKLFGVRVNEFALGMGPTIFKKQGKETKYALRLFPIGGFCAMEGEDDESEDERAFCNKKIWQRMIIVAAGATFNIILGIIICGFLVSSNDYIGTNRILQFYEGAVSNSETGLQVDDKILEIDGKHVFSDYDISFLMQRNNTGKYDFVVERNGEKVKLPEVNFATRTGGNFAFSKENEISSVSAKLKKSGLKDGDKIIKVNGESVKTNEQLSAAINKDDDYTIDYVVLRDGEEIEVSKVKMAVVTVFDFIIKGEDKNFFNVTSGAFKYALSMSRMVYLCLFDMLSGRYGLNEMTGAVGTVYVIADVAQESVASADWSSLFMIMALITINIGLFNLLPVPALDGGRLFFMFIELIFRKPIPAKYESWIHAAGLVLLLILMAVITASDIWKWVSGIGFY